MFKCCGARRTCQGRDWRHDQDNGRQANQGRTLELCFLDHYKRLLWRKRENERETFVVCRFESSHSFYLSIKFILLANIKSFMLCHYSQAMVCPPPMTVSRPAPAILSSYNSASLLEDAQGGSHSCEVLSRTIKLDILLWGLGILLK